MADIRGKISFPGTVKGALNGLEKIQGYSAYEVAVIFGFEGTEEEWLESLKCGAQEAADNANAAAENANNSAMAADTATDAAIAATDNAKEATLNTNIATDNANLATDHAIEAANTANTAAESAQKTAEEIRNAKQNGEFDGKSFTYDMFTPEQLASLRGETGRGIASIVRTKGNGAPGTIDTYTVTFTDMTTSEIFVYNGKDGEGSGDMTSDVYDPQNKKRDVFKYVDDAVGNIPTPDVSGQINTHNNSAEAHSDIRNLAKSAETTANAALPKSGGTMTGALTLAADPTENLHATPKRYVDNAIASIPKPDVSGEIGAHNTATDAHNDLRLLITELTNRLNALANSEDVDLDQMAELVAYIKDNRELIEQITTNKVSVSDIINNLTTNVSNKPLSAAQGVALKALIDGIFVPTKTSQLTNDSGFFNTKPSYTASEVGAAPESHKHNASDINAGTMSIDRLPLSELASALGAGKVATGSYKATGSTSLSITFPFSPKFVAILATTHWSSETSAVSFYVSGSNRYIGLASNSAYMEISGTNTATHSFAVSNNVKNYLNNDKSLTYAWVAVA